MELIETAGTKSAMGAFMIANPKFPTPEVKFETEYLAGTHDPITPMAGARVLPTKTFSEVGSKQFDIILIPGGDNTRPGEPSKALTEFLEAQVPGARYVLSVCTGSWVLATLGFLDGKRATTNKFLFNEIKSTTSPLIHWVPRARWVVDGKFWTGSGVTAGQDMGLAFLKALQGTEFALAAKNVMEFRAVTSADDDEFADVFHLA
ncbi:Class I glutamine amidotransferase-like protein, partial [Rhizoctonia solani]